MAEAAALREERFAKLRVLVGEKPPAALGALLGEVAALDARTLSAAAQAAEATRAELQQIAQLRRSLDQMGGETPPRFVSRRA